MCGTGGHSLSLTRGERASRREHEELRETHLETLLHNDQLKQSVSQLEQALKQRRQGATDLSRGGASELTRRISELKGRNASLWEEVREKDQVVGELRGRVEVLTSKLRLSDYPEAREEHAGQGAGSRGVTPRGRVGVQGMRRELDLIRADHVEEMARRRKLEEEVIELMATRTTFSKEITTGKDVERR